jgi:drug/metabolite transporter (DMT)-like permease
LLFGSSTPLARLLVGHVSPQMLAGLLYLGSGVGLGMVLLIRVARRPLARREMHLAGRDIPWLLLAALLGGAVGPVLLMKGLTHTDGATASLLLNLESVLTAALAWGIFKENADRQIVLGMAAIVVGGVLLAWRDGGGAWSPGALLIAGACLSWAVDNNVTRMVSASDAMMVACIKGLLAGACNTALALAGGAALPAASVLGGSLLVGFLGYGISLTLFVVGLRTLGTARTGAYFSVAPLFGVLLSLALWPQWPSLLFCVAAALMAAGVWLHVRERHDHEHTHEPMGHSHRHRHDAHHQHVHAFAWQGDEPHTHWHHHELLIHKHPHYPDIHHRHAHPR